MLSPLVSGFCFVFLVVSSYVIKRLEEEEVDGYDDEVSNSRTKNKTGDSVCEYIYNDSNSTFWF